MAEKDDSTVQSLYICKQTVDTSEMEDTEAVLLGQDTWARLVPPIERMTTSCAKYWTHLPMWWPMTCIRKHTRHGALVWQSAAYRGRPNCTGCTYSKSKMAKLEALSAMVTFQQCCLGKAWQMEL